MDNMKYEKAVMVIRSILKDYITKNGLECLVIGESGGIDSCLCTVLASPVCEKLGIPLIARSITIETNKPDEIKRAERVGTLFASDFQEMDLTDLYNKMRYDLLDPISVGVTELAFKIACGNLKARLRMINLYALAGLNKGMVLSTDNYTELLTGFWTLHGDVGDFGMVQNLWKTEVYEMAEYIANTECVHGDERYSAIMECVCANPTDGLGITNSDLDQLGVATYAEADAILKKYQGYLPMSERAELNKHPLIKRWMATEHKRNNPYNIPRDEIVN